MPGPYKSRREVERKAPSVIYCVGHKVEYSHDTMREAVVSECLLNKTFTDPDTRISIQELIEKA
jgi:hypothetical protein